MDTPPPSPSAARIVELLRQRDGEPTNVWLRNGQHFVVINIAWGQDLGDREFHITTNISPAPSNPHTTDFFSTADVERIGDPESGDTLFEYTASMESSGPPIQNVDAFDVVGERRDGGVDLVVSCSGPLDSSPRTLELIERKIVAYLVTIAHANFARTYRAAERGPSGFSYRASTSYQTQPKGLFTLLT
jgi:hypothetical protein